MAPKANRSCPLRLLPNSVRERYAEWLLQHERQLESMPGAGQLGPFWSRMAMTTLKQALILHVANAGTLLMDDAALESAIGLTEFQKLALANLFDEEMAFTPDMRNGQKVLKAIRKRPGISYRDISRSASLLKRQLEGVLETLLAEGLVEVRDKFYWPVTESVAVSDGATDTRPAMFSRVK